jgi:hypothetical protein
MGEHGCERSSKLVRHRRNVLAAAAALVLGFLSTYGELCLRVYQLSHESTLLFQQQPDLVRGLLISLSLSDLCPGIEKHNAAGIIVFRDQVNVERTPGGIAHERQLYTILQIVVA